MPYIMPQRARPRSPLGATLATGLTGIARKPSATPGYPTRNMQPVAYPLAPHPPQPAPQPAPSPIRADVGRPTLWSPGDPGSESPAPPDSITAPMTTLWGAPIFNVGQPTNPVPPITTGTTDMFSSAPMQPPMAHPGPGLMGTPTPITQGTGATAGFPYAGSDTNNGHPIFYNATAGMYVDSSGTAADPDTISNWQPNMDPRSIAAANNPNGIGMIHPGDHSARSNPLLAAVQPPGQGQGINALANPGNFGTTQIP